MNTHQKGAIGEFKVAIAAIKKDFCLSKPILERRYDYVLDTGNALYRVQVKYADCLESGALKVKLRSECRNNGYRRGYSDKEVDFILVYAPTTDKVYKLGPEIFLNKSSVQLRIQPTKNHQKTGVRFLSDYEW